MFDDEIESTLDDVWVELINNIDGTVVQEENPHIFCK